MEEHGWMALGRKVVGSLIAAIIGVTFLAVDVRSTSAQGNLGGIASPQSPAATSRPPASGQFGPSPNQYGPNQYGPNQYGPNQYDVGPAQNRLPGYSSDRQAVYRPPSNSQGTDVARAEMGPPPASGINWKEFERARIMARVGDDIVLAGDILGMVDQQLAPYQGKVPEDQMEAQRELLIRKQLQTTVERKTLYQAFIRTIPPDRREEALAGVWEQVTERFYDEELPEALKRAKVEDAKAFEEKLREFGWSMRKQIQTYGERQLGMYGALQKVDRKPEVTHAEMIAVYRENQEQYRVAAQAKFEKLTARFDRFNSEQEAYDAVARMGDEVVLGGAPFWAVAKRSSQGVNADEGGAYDWTAKGSLASQPIDEAIFSIPVGKMSRIIRDERGFHIVRVTERKEERFIPFVEAQAAIKKKLEGEKRTAAFNKYIADAKAQIPVWTIFDETDATEERRRR